MMNVFSRKCFVIFFKKKKRRENTVFFGVPFLQIMIDVAASMFLRFPLPEVAPLE